MTVQKSLPASWAKVRKVYKDRKWFRGRLDCFFFSSDSESLYASTREPHGVGWGSVAGLTENKTKPTCLSPIFVLWQRSGSEVKY